MPYTLYISNYEICLKYQRFIPSGGKNIGIRKSEFVAKTQFLCIRIYKPVEKLTKSASRRVCMILWRSVLLKFRLYTPKIKKYKLLYQICS